MSDASKSVTNQQKQKVVVSDLLAGKWTLPVIRALGKDVLRFGVLQRTLPDTAQKVLTETLRKLERGGIVDRKIYPTVPPQVEYKLTPLGLDLLKLSGVLSEWVDEHVDEIERAQDAYNRRNKL